MYVFLGICELIIDLSSMFPQNDRTDFKNLQVYKSVSFGRFLELAEKCKFFCPCFSQKSYIDFEYGKTVMSWKSFLLVFGIDRPGRFLLINYWRKFHVILMKLCIILEIMTLRNILKYYGHAKSSLVINTHYSFGIKDLFISLEVKISNLYRHNFKSWWIPIGIDDYLHKKKHYQIWYLDFIG